tara:strand:+ start:24270 stop:24506 length:237 start_codon:yes stop_codon:yes gene_type:complete
MNGKLEGKAMVRTDIFCANGKVVRQLFYVRCSNNERKAVSQVERVDNNRANFVCTALGRSIRSHRESCNNYNTDDKTR